MQVNHHQMANTAYVRIVEVLLALKAEGYGPDVLADAIARAAYQAGVERITTRVR